MKCVHRFIRKPYYSKCILCNLFIPVYIREWYPDGPAIEVDYEVYKV